MADKTRIEWAEATWNPATGCTHVSPGCAHCYIERTPPFRTSGRAFARVGDAETTGIVLHPERLDQPLRWKKPRLIFVCSLSDLFHEEIPDEYIYRVFDVMNEADRHTFQVLTKRPERALEVLRAYYADVHTSQGLSRTRFVYETPLANVWIGVSIENARYTWRADVLREIPAAVRFISAEPLLGSLFETDDRGCPEPRWDGGVKFRCGLGGDGNVCSIHGEFEPARKPLDLTGIDWLIVGGESGGRFARPMHPAWARELRDACRESWPTVDLPLVDAETGEDAGVAEGFPVGLRRTAFFFKQWGSWTLDPYWSKPTVGVLPDGRVLTDSDEIAESGAVLMRYAGASPKSGGRLLDGRAWDEMPGHAGQGVLFAGVEA